MIEFLLEYKELIVIFSGIGTFISAMIAVFTLNEVKKQRLSLYKPEILIKSFLVSISKSPLQKVKEELMKYKTCDFNDYSNNYNENKFEINSKYKIDNLGFGIAKNIKCTWEFKTKKAITEIQKVLPTNYEFNWDKELNLYFLNNSENEDFYYSAFGNIERQEIDYISPINVQKNNHLHTIPEIIIYTHYLFLIFKENLVGKKAENFHIFKFNNYKFPEPILKVEYNDLNGKKYKYKYRFKITAVNLQIEDTLDLTKEFAYLQFKLI
jgi:hypothetical protein